MENNKYWEEPAGKVVEAKSRNVIQETIRCHPWGNRVLKRICLDGPNDLYSLSKNLLCSYNSNGEIFQQFGLQQCQFLPELFTLPVHCWRISPSYKDCILTRCNSQCCSWVLLLQGCSRSVSTRGLIIGEMSFQPSVVEAWIKLEKWSLTNFINYREHRD